MPQPLSTFKNLKGGVSFGESALEKNPELSSKALQAIASWSMVESRLLMVYMKLLKSPSDYAALAFLVVDNRGTKSNMIRTVAKEALSERNYKLLEAIIKTSKSYQSKRDKLAHWEWGSCAIEDAFVLMNPRHAHEPAASLSLSKMLLYRAHDFEQMTTENQNLRGILLKFHRLLDDPSSDNDKLYDALCAEPAIRDNLSHQA